MKKATKKTTTKKTTSWKKSSQDKTRYSEPLIEPDLSRPVRLYKITETYAPGDRVNHPKFGQGVVEMLRDDGKMNVLFEGGRQTLAHKR